MVRNAVEGDYADGTGTKVESTALTIPAGDFKWQLPIPQSQRDLNSNTTKSWLLVCRFKQLKITSLF
jgi:hypothetical protein